MCEPAGERAGHEAGEDGWQGIGVYVQTTEHWTSMPNSKAGSQAGRYAHGDNPLRQTHLLRLHLCGDALCLRLRLDPLAIAIGAPVGAPAGAPAAAAAMPAALGMLLLPLVLLLLLKLLELLLLAAGASALRRLLLLLQLWLACLLLLHCLRRARWVILARCHQW